MADLSAIKLPNGTTYNLKDRGALPLTGGAVTGPVTFGDSISIDDATIGSLVVNGGASFTNNIQANTINGVTVGNSPKFTDTNTEVSTLTLTSSSTAGTALTSGGKFTLTAGSKTVSFTMPTIPTVPSNIVNTITTTAGAHTAITSQKGNVSFNVPTTAAHVGAATSDHAHGNITNGGDITATAPTIASGDQIIINDNSASKVTNGPTFDGSTTTTALTPKGTWESFSKFSGSYNDLTNKPTIPSVASLLDIFYPVGTIYETTVGPETFNPKTAWGGDWIQIHGRFLVAEGNNEATGDEALNLSAGNTGGKKIVTLSAAQSGMRAHTHAVGSHYHNLYNHHHTPNTTGENFLCVDTTVSNASFTISTAGNNRYTVGYSGTGHFHARADTGKPDSNNTGNTTYSTRASDGTLSGTAYTGAVKDISGAAATTSHENMPPYLAVYMWKRIA